MNNFKDGFGEFLSFGGPKYIGNFKNDKKDGFGLHYLLKETYYIGFWEKGKLEGIAKCFIGNEYNYSFWIQDKKQRVFMDENEMEDNNYDLEKYSILFKIEVDSIRHFFEEDIDIKMKKKKNKKKESLKNYN